MSDRPEPADSGDRPLRTAARGAPGSRSRMFVERRRPDSIRSNPKAHWYVVATVCVGALMGQLDASIVTLAFPTLQREFHASLPAVEWVSLSYLLVLISSVIAVGRMSDMIGRKLVYVWGFALFGLASLGCGLAPSLAVLVMMRMVQALGAAMLQANSIALISTSTPAEHLGKALGVQGAAQALGLALGPTVGGLLLAVGTWRLIFLVNVPVSVVGFASGWYLLPRSRHLAARVPLDWVGLATFVPAISGLLVFLSLGSRDGFLQPSVCAVLLAALAFFAGFVTWERRYRGTPLVDLGLFGRRAYRSGILGGLVAFLVMFGLMFVVPFLLENARHTSPASAGLLLTVLPLMLGLVAPFGGRLADRLGPRTLRVGGMACLAAGSGLMAARGGQSPAALVTGLALSGVGLGAFIPANNSSFMASVRTEQSGAASGMINLARGLGTSLGVALTGLVFAAVQGKGAPPAPASVEDGFSAACAMLAGLALLGVAVSAAPTAKARRQPEPRRRRGHLDTGRD